MVLRVDHKNELIKNFHALKDINNIEFVEEENLLDLLTQLSETMYNYTLSNDYSPDHDHYIDYQVKSSLRIEKDYALSQIILHRGSFL